MLASEPRRGRASGFARPPDVAPAYAALVRTALGLALVPGLGLGLLLVGVYGLRVPLALPWPLLAQGHGQVQLLGFTLLFVLAVALQLLPRFFAAPIAHPGRVGLGGALIAGGVLMRLVAQPLEPDPARAAALVLAAALVPAGALLALAELVAMRRRSVQPMRGAAAAWQSFVVVGALALVGSLLVHAAALLALAGGAPMVPTGLDEALVHLELAGFATCLVLGVSSRILGRLLLLRSRPALADRLWSLAAAYGCGLALVAAGWLTDAAAPRLVGYAAELAVVAAWLWLVGLYGRPSRPSTTPHVTDPTRRWLRAAFAFLLLGAVLPALLTARDVSMAVAPSGTAWSAARHASAQGFLLVVIVVMAARMLPVYASDAAAHRGRLEFAVDLLLAGALLRVGAELVGGYAGVAGPLTALGGAASVGGFAVFAVGLLGSVGRSTVLTGGGQARPRHVSARRVADEEGNGST